MIRVRIPIKELRNEMEKVDKSTQRSNKFLISQAIINKYKDTIFKFHDSHKNKDKSKSSDLLSSKGFSRSGSVVQGNSDDLVQKQQIRRVSKKEERKSINSSLENNASKEDTEHQTNDVEITIDAFENREHMKNEELVPRLVSFKSLFNESADSEINTVKIGGYNKRHQRFQDGF